LAKIKTGFSVHEKELCKTGEEKLMIAYWSRIHERTICWCFWA
jgi:hypothetical protein